MLRYPHVFESGERCQDGTADPDRIFSLGSGDDSDFHVRTRQSGYLLFHSVSEARETGCATREDYIGVEILTDVNVTLSDAVECQLVNAAGFHT